jgi:hypothetical protein
MHQIKKVFAQNFKYESTPEKKKVWNALRNRYKDNIQQDSRNLRVPLARTTDIHFAQNIIPGEGIGVREFFHQHYSINI